MRKCLAEYARKFAAPLTLLLIALLILPAKGQFRRHGGRFHRGFDIREAERIKEQDMMKKALDPAFVNDVFTFARLRFEADSGPQFGGWRQWEDDSPDADLNLTFRLFQVTSLKVRPGLNFVDITVAEMPEYPFVYMAAGGRVILTDEEAAALRNYLLNGGFLMIDDFWGDDQWRHFYEQIKKVFPDREPIELPLDHPIFHNVYRFKAEPQIPSVGAFMSSGLPYDPEWPFEEKSHDPHYYGVYDDKQRMMVLACHNNHFGDGWEHEGDDQSYFNVFSMPMAYPMFINIITYAMEH